MLLLKFKNKVKCPEDFLMRRRGKPVCLVLSL